MAKTKYVVVNMWSGFSKNETIVVFPEFIEHKEMADRLVDNRDDVLAGGFCHFKDDLGNETACYGQSVSLGLPSRGDRDTLLLKRLNCEGEEWY